MILHRPLAFISIQAARLRGAGKAATVKHSRIAALDVLRIDLDGTTTADSFMVNPLAIDPSGEPGGVQYETPFAQIAGPVREFLEGCDLAGFGLRRFDLPLLAEEFARCGHLDFPPDTAAVVDVQTIFGVKERRDLAAAVRFYIGAEPLMGINDTGLVWEVLRRQLQRYNDLPADVDALAAWCYQGKELADFAGNFYYERGEMKWAFGKHKDKPVDAADEYAQWYLRDTFPFQSQKVLAEYIGADWWIEQQQQLIQNL